MDAGLYCMYVELIAKSLEITYPIIKFLASFALDQRSIFQVPRNHAKQPRATCSTLNAQLTVIKVHNFVVQIHSAFIQW